MASKHRLIKKLGFFSGIFFIILFSLFFFFNPEIFQIAYNAQPTEAKTAIDPLIFLPTHIDTPYPVKAIYMTQCVVGNQSLRNKLVSLILRTELNAVVIDLKDYSGRISFHSSTAILKNKTSPTCATADMAQFVDSLHKKGIYVIGRITTFQDPFFAKERPDLAIKTNSNKAVAWKDKKGISYIDPGAKDMWDYILTIAREARNSLGFDEINFDYIRFPSDGNMSDIYFPFSEGIIKSDPSGGKAAVLKGFYQYVSKELKKYQTVLSADLFGMTTTNTDDLNIGQVLEDVLPSFDYVAPMVYPSHYPPGFINLPNPAANPYEVIKYSMDHALKRASTTPLKLRPWLQDFNLGAQYTADMVRKEKNAVYDTGLESWMMWNAANVYTEGALDLKAGIGSTTSTFDN